MASLINIAGKQFGSDVYAHYTAVYSWNSNQMAHAMMGFAGTTLFMHTAVQLGFDFWHGALFYVIPFLKDLTDVVADRSVHTHQFAMKPPHRCEICLDAVTDNFFWVTGLLLALFLGAMSCEGRPWWTCVLILAVILLLVTGIFVARRHFIEQKKRFDVSGLPYYFRLPCYSGKLAVDPNSNPSTLGPIKEVENFVYQHGTSVRHLLLYGPPRSFKTTLAVAIGSGLTVRRRAVRYLSEARLIEEYATPALGGRNPTEPIPPHKADIVIVDDLDHPDEIREVLPAMTAKSTVWVVSSSRRTEIRDWMKVLKDGLGEAPARIELEPNEPNREMHKSPTLLVNLLAVFTLLVSIVSLVTALALLMAPQLFGFLCLCEAPLTI